MVQYSRKEEVLCLDYWHSKMKINRFLESVNLVIGAFRHKTASSTVRNLRNLKGCTIIDQVKLLDAFISVRAARNPMSQILCVRTKDGNKFFASPSASLGLPSEPLTHDFFRTVITKEDTFVDVGANVGGFTVPIAKIAGRVISIEPSPTKEFLRRNIALNDLKNVVIIDKAAFNTATKVRFYYDSNASSLSSLFKRNTSGNVVEMDVETTTLDEILEDIGKIKAIKVDAEGAEIEVLQGARRILTKVDFIVIEVQREHLQMVRELLAGFTLYSLGESSNLLAVNNRLNEPRRKYWRIRRS